MTPRSGARNEGVSSVVGTVLMLAVTLSVFAGFSFVVLESYAEDNDRLRADLGVVEEDGNYLLHHRGGDALALADGRLLVTVDGTRTEVPLSDLSAQTDDGLTWRIGEVLCLSGPQPPCHYDHGEVGEVLLVYRNAVVLSDSGLLGDDPVTTYIASYVATAGTVNNFDNAKAAGDPGPDASLVEASTLGSPGSTTVTLSGSSTAGNSVADHADALASDDVRASLNAAGDWVEVSGLSVPAGATGITAVTLGFEGKGATGGNSDPTVQLSYFVSTTAGTTTLSQTLTSTTTDAPFTVAVTADRAWTVADVNALKVRVQGTTVGNRNAEVDHIYVTITYSTAPVTTYALNVQMDFPAGIPIGSQTLELDYRVSGDTFRVQVWDGTAYTTRGTALTAAASTAWTYTLTAAEYNGGAPRIRFVDLESASAQGTLWLGHVRLVTA